MNHQFIFLSLYFCLLVFPYSLEALFIFNILYSSYYSFVCSSPCKYVRAVYGWFFSPVIIKCTCMLKSFSWSQRQYFHFSSLEYITFRYLVNGVYYTKKVSKSGCYILSNVFFAFMEVLNTLMWWIILIDFPMFQQFSIPGINPSC